MSGNPFASSMPYLNGYNYAEPRDTGIDTVREVVRETRDEQLEQVRDLLFGDLQRSFEARLQTLESRLQMLEHKLDQVRHESRTHRDEHIDALAQGIDELGRHVRRLTRS